MFEFAALRFTEDENLSDRVYWYRSPFPAETGGRVLAPVGARCRLEAARVERVMKAERENAPYPFDLLKSVISPDPVPLPEIGGVLFRDFGGMRYDRIRYTVPRVLYYADTMPEDADTVRAFKVERIFEAPMSDDEEIYRAILGHGTLLVGGEGKEIFRTLLRFVRGKGGLPVSEREARAVARRLTSV